MVSYQVRQYQLTTTGTKPLDFYSTLWSLQKYFAHPPSLDGPAIGEPAQTPFDQFRAKSDFVLSRLYEQTKREKVLLGKNPDRATRKRTRESEDLSYPRYLTAKNLLDYELADQQFRRQVLVQYFILFQFLLNLTPASANKQQFTGGMPKTFIIDGDKQTWITQTIQAVRDELRNMSPDGPRFEETLVQLMQRERRYVGLSYRLQLTRNRHNGKTKAVPSLNGRLPLLTPTWVPTRPKSGSVSAAPCAGGLTSSVPRASPVCGRTDTRA